MPNYIPEFATIEQSCEWMHARLGGVWILQRLLECHLKPYFWIDYQPGYPHIFGGKVEGYLSWMIFSGDVHRLKVDGTNALVNMFPAHDGNLVKTEPGWIVPLSELKFKREALERVATILEGEALRQKSAPSGAPEKTAHSSNGLVAYEPQTETDSPSPALAEFRNMVRLSWNEVRIDIVAGESGSILLNVCAREITRRIALAEIELVDKRKGEMNQQAAVLLVLAQGGRVATTPEMPRRVSRLRNVLMTHFGINSDPFEIYNGQAGYKPVFKIADNRSAADERAKKDAARRTISFDNWHERIHRARLRFAG